MCVYVCVHECRVYEGSAHMYVVFIAACVYMCVCRSMSVGSMGHIIMYIVLIATDNIDRNQGMNPYTRETYNSEAKDIP